MYQHFVSTSMQSSYKVDTQLCINFVTTPYELCIENDTGSCYKVETKLCTQSLIHNFVSNPCEFRIRVATKSWHKFDTQPCINFVSTPWEGCKRSGYKKLTQSWCRVWYTTFVSTLYAKFIRSRSHQSWYESCDINFCINIVTTTFELCVPTWWQQSSYGVDTNLIHNSVSTLYRLRVNFVSTLMQSFDYVWTLRYKVDTKR